MGRVKATRWVRFAVVSVLFVAWVIWLGSPWVLVFWFLLADIYLTQFIPWTWWRHTKNKVVKEIMTWVDAIVYALILVYFLFLYVGQNYQIPSSSLEKSLLVGDYLWVNKMVYGPRVPNTPIHFPLAQNTLPVLNCKSYLDKPQWGYHRLKGLRSVERGDIVVFNFPAGDTVSLKVQNPDYYTLVHMYGHYAVNNDKATYGDVIFRPVDRRENYVKRCIGLPGERLQIVDNVVYINGHAIATPRLAQFNYFVQTDGRAISDDVWTDLGVSVDDRAQLQVDLQDAPGVEALGMRVDSDGNIAPIYQVPLTEEMRKKIAAEYQWITAVVKVPTQEMFPPYPITRNYGWTRSDYGEVWIPKKGANLRLTIDNLPIYERCIKNYEGNSLEVKDGHILINGKEANSYTFKMDYYWMMGDNRDNSLDSRYWGFVPEDHIVGTPMFILLSIDKDKGGVRWERTFRSANPE
ncbi:MAG: S26 family signal peptidase [Muribaculaceae bacterium]